MMTTYPLGRPDAARVRSLGAHRAYSVAEVAELLGISRSTAYECVRRGEIPALQFGQRLVLPVDAIERLLVDPALLVAEVDHEGP
jgi:excisionase family DNA binding protein